MPSEPFIGEISMFAGNFAIRGYALCHGQLLPISQNIALFSILGTTYGGNGQTTFALPDLRGRVPIGQGQGPGLSNYQLGQQTGVENVTLLTTQIPAHNHNFTINPKAISDEGDTSDPTDAFPAHSGPLDREYKANGTAVAMGATNGTTANSGGSQPHTNLQPVLAINFLIALEGLFPPRN